MKDLVMKFLSENGYDDILAIHYFFDENDMLPGHLHEVMFMSKVDSSYVVNRIVLIDDVIRFADEDDELGESYAYDLCDSLEEALDNFMYDVEQILM